MANEVALGSLVDGGVVDRHCSALMALDRTKLAERALQSVPVNILDMRVWDSLISVLPAAATADDLGIVTGATYGTNMPVITSGDCKAATTTRRCRQILTLDPQYDNAGDVTVRLMAGMVTTVSDGTATIDVECYKLFDDGTLSADLCTTAATSINSLTLANRDFVITPTGFVAGDRLDVRITIAVVDTATATAVTPTLRTINLRQDIRG